MNRYAVVVALSLSGADAAYAADVILDQPQAPAPEVLESPNWALQITPYLWAAGLEGDISPFRRGPTIGVDKSFSDVMDDLNFGGFVNI